MNEDLSPEERQQVRRAFERTSEQGWGLALGFLCAIGLFLATIVLLVTADQRPVGPHLGLLAIYLERQRTGAVHVLLDDRGPVV